MPDPASLPATNGTLQMATEADYVPFTYVRDGRVVGYDLEIVALFCQARGYGMQIVNMNFDGILPSVQSGKCQLAVSGITITPEREESVLFHDLYLGGGFRTAQLPAPGHPKGLNKGDRGTLETGDAEPSPVSVPCLQSTAVLLKVFDSGMI